MIENLAQQFFNMKKEIEEPRTEVIEKQYTVEIWFKDRYDASAYKAERKYTKNFELLKDVKEDPSRRANKFCRLYQSK